MAIGTKTLAPSELDTFEDQRLVPGSFGVCPYASLARGAVRAALWGFDKKPGLYSMTDVLGLE